MAWRLGASAATVAAPSIPVAAVDAEDLPSVKRDYYLEHPDVATMTASAADAVREALTLASLSGALDEAFTPLSCGRGAFSVALPEDASEDASQDGDDESTLPDDASEDASEEGGDESDAAARATASVVGVCFSLLLLL